MSRRTGTPMFALLLALLLAAAPAAAQSDAPVTPWGHPDLQGVWTNKTTTPWSVPRTWPARRS